MVDLVSASYLYNLKPGTDISPVRRDDNRLRSYLEDKGVIKTKQQATRDELIAKMKASYVSATDPAWQAWSDSYIVSVYLQYSRASRKNNFLFQPSLV